ncbi:beta-galactosidase trimerization domain-containing protein [Chitinophaga sp. MM2321]|uniref:beta-galactosidase trimerization domain-containing protein n=1 Tax=Chitinophaga sp. MM2321 TaxID=3137178 RepID=UPI0032D568F5
MKNIVLFLFLLLCGQNVAAQQIIGSFENIADLKNIAATNGTVISRSTDFPAVGAWSLKTVFPAKGGTVYLNNLEATRWNRAIASDNIFANALLLFIWATNATEINVLVKDSLDHTAALKYALKPGVNHIQVPFAALNKIDLEQVKAIGIQGNSPALFYLDYIALDEYQPVLEQGGRWDVPYSAGVQTKHIPWGVPLAGGKIKTYAISPVFDGRGIIELSERLDLDYKVTTLGRNPGINRWGFGDFYNRRNPMGDDGTHPNSLVFNYIAADLLYGPEVDLIIWPGLFPWESYPLQIRNAILKRVANGTGLLLIYPASHTTAAGQWPVSPLHPTDTGIFRKMNGMEHNKKAFLPYLDATKWVTASPHFITRGVALEAFPMGHMGVVPTQGKKEDVLLRTAKGNPVLAVGTYGKGRVVAMSYAERGLIPMMDNPWETGAQVGYWDYMWSLVARAAVWVAKREPATFIKNVTHHTNNLTVQLHGVAAQEALTMQVVDAFGKTEQDTTFFITAGQEKLELPFSKYLAGGRHMANLQLKSGQSVHDWYTIAFTTSQVAVIDSIHTERSEIPTGEEVTATATLHAAQAVSGTLQASLFDNYGRLVDKKDYPVTLNGKSKVSIRFQSGNVLTPLGKIDLVLQVDGKEIDHKEKELFFLHPRKWDDYDVTMYHFGPNPVPGTWAAIDNQLKQVHVTTLAAYTLENSKHANYKVQAQTRIKGVESPDNGPDLEYYEAMKKKYLATHDKKVLVRKYGLNDSVYLHSVKNDLKRMVSEWKKFSPSAYYIYEEPSITRYDDALDLDFSDITLKAMRTWLKAQYGTLPALNQQWGTAFNTWDSVVPDDSREARQRGNTSSWADHRSFMEKTWAGQFKYVQEALNEFDPGGLVQLSGTQASGAHNGYDYSQIDKYVGQMNPYDIGNQLEYHRNFNPDVKVSGQGGYGAMGKGVLYDFYRHIFVNETAGAYIFWQQSVLNPDLTVCKSGLYLKDALYEMRQRGIGRLISNYKPENENKIAIHYSYPSIHGAWIADGEISTGHVTKERSKTLAQFRNNLDGWVKVLHDAGIGFDFMAYSGIENNDLITKGYKVLVLPMSIALSDKEAEQITAFVRQGGTVITDALAGVMDGHTRYREHQALADVFGIAPQAYSRKDLITPAYDDKLVVKGASSLSQEKERPQLLSHHYGDGKAFLLNYYLDKYPEEKLKKNNENSLAKIRQVLTAAGITSSIEITASTGNATSGITKYSFAENSGSGKLLGLLPEESITDTNIVIHLKERVHLYDIRNDHYLGEGSSFPLSVTPGVPVLLGLLKDKVDGITVQAPAEVKPGEQVSCRLQCSGNNKMLLHSVAVVKVYNPVGELMDIYSGNCNIDGNNGVFSFTTALNDVRGEWTVKVKEVISGVVTEAKIKVQ